MSEWLSQRLNLSANITSHFSASRIATLGPILAVVLRVNHFCRLLDEAEEYRQLSDTLSREIGRNGPDR